MSTRNILIRRLPRLQRLLLDGDIDPELADYLRAVGFEVLLAPRDNPGIIEDDVEVLRYARRRRRILECHDKFGDRATQLRLFPEMYHNGGRVLRIGGDSSQSLVGALGKVLVHHEQWIRWFEENPHGGRITVFATKFVATSADEFMARHLYRMHAGDDVPPLPPRRRGRRGPRATDTPVEQLPLRLE